jgi:hypothetical protein
MLFLKFINLFLCNMATVVKSVRDCGLILKPKYGIDHKGTSLWTIVLESLSITAYNATESVYLLYLVVELWKIEDARGLLMLRDS